MQTQLFTLTIYYLNSNFIWAAWLVLLTIPLCDQRKKDEMGGSCVTQGVQQMHRGMTVQKGTIETHCHRWEDYINTLVPHNRYTCHTEWYLKHLIARTEDGLSWPLLSRPHVNSGLLHINLSILFQHQRVSMNLNGNRMGTLLLL